MTTSPLAPVPIDEPEPRKRIPWEEIVAYAIIGAGLLFVLLQHLVSAFIVGLTLYLILDRVWADVWGQDFAAARIHGESTWTATYDYASAWEWASKLTVDQRGVLWNRLLTMNDKPYCYAVYLGPTTAAAQPPRATSLTP